MDHEIKGHTKKIYKVWKNPAKKSTEKIKEIAIEIGIIVFAITLSMWFHNWSLHTHEQKDVKAFLVGLNIDLKSDIAEMKEDVESFKGSAKIFSYIKSLKMGQPANQDTINKYTNRIFGSTRLNANAGRFEGFKSSGKIAQIENQLLQSDILGLYEEDIPHLLGNIDNYNNNKESFLKSVINNYKRITDSSSNFKNIIGSDIGYAHALLLCNTDEIEELYKVVITKNEKIIASTNKEYNLK